MFDDKILISTICDSYQEFYKHNHNATNMLLLDKFMQNLFVQLNIDISKRMIMSTKIKTVINSQMMKSDRASSTVHV